jgi:MFS family permease
VAAHLERPAQRVSRNVVVLSWVSFFQDAASEMLYPVLPLFLTGVLGASPAAVGLIEGLAEALSSILKGVSGQLADRMARRPLVALGYGLSSVSKGLIAIATGWPFVLFCRSLDRVGKGIRTSPRDALIASDTLPEMRGQAFGFHSAFDTAGAVVGPLVGLVLYELLHHRLRPLFALAVIPAMVSTALIGFVRENRHPQRDRRNQHGAGPLPLPESFWRMIIFLAIFGLANFSDALIILRMKQLGLGFVSVMLAYALYNLSYAGFSYPAGIVSDRIPKSLVFATGLAFFSIAYLGFGLIQHAKWIWPLLVVYGAYTALTDGVGKAWIAETVPAESVGTALGYFQGILGIGSLIAGIWAGLAWGRNGTIPFLLSGSVVALLALTLILWQRPSRFGNRPLKSSVA